MITGTISPNREATVNLTAFGPTGNSITFDAVIDTGFDDFVTLQPAQIVTLSLARRATIRAALADGTIVSLPVYSVEIVWHGVRRKVDAIETHNDALIGMSLLYGSRVTLDVIDGGTVMISPLLQQRQ